MFIAHLPAGYISTKYIINKSQSIELPLKDTKLYIVVGLIAAMLPDFDMLYFYLIDNRQHLHHGYATHLPIFWAVPIAIWALLSVIFKNQKSLLLSLIVGVNVILHLFLDTFVGKVRWLYPLSNMDFYFFDVPAKYNWWVWNFVLHWTFLFELAILTTAGFILYRSSRIVKCIK